MRTLFICALAATVVDCSGQPPSLVPPCLGSNPLACATAVQVPLEPDAPARPHPRQAAAGPTTTQPKPATLGSAGPATRAAPRTAEASQQTTGKAVAAPAGVAASSSTTGIARSRSIQEVVTTGTVAGKMPAATAASTPDALVAVLMAGPGVKSVSELTGKTIAIDDRYAASNRSVRTAIAAAGAPEVKLSEGQTTAINRLVTKEVPAAVVALVSAGAADGFPELAGFKSFQIPLSARSLNR